MNIVFTYSLLYPIIFTILLFVAIQVIINTPQFRKYISFCKFISRMRRNTGPLSHLMLGITKRFSIFDIESCLIQTIQMMNSFEYEIILFQKQENHTAI